jgi:DNA-binding response OmpR family regulator
LGARRRRSSTILLVDGEGARREHLRGVLEEDGFVVAVAGDGQAAVDHVAQVETDLVVLDLDLDLDRAVDRGLDLDLDAELHLDRRRAGGRGEPVPRTTTDVLRRVRSLGTVPVIVLSTPDGGGGDIASVVGGPLGVDDFLVKPFEPLELLTRVRAALRRSGRASTLVLDHGALTIDVDAREVRRHDAVVRLTAREFDLLVFLASSPGQVFSADQLLRDVWGSDPDWQRPTTVGEHVYRLRRKLEADPAAPRHLLTSRGAGYRFEP